MIVLLRQMETKRLLGKKTVSATNETATSSESEVIPSIRVKEREMNMHLSSLAVTTQAKNDDR